VDISETKNNFVVKVRLPTLEAKDVSTHAEIHLSSTHPLKMALLPVRGGSF